VIKNRTSITEETLSKIEEIVGDPDKAKRIVLAARASMGQDISSYDMDSIERFADRVINLAEYRYKSNSNSPIHFFSLLRFILLRESKKRSKFVVVVNVVGSEQR
jgi:hypothetical protein